MGSGFIALKFRDISVRVFIKAGLRRSDESRVMEYLIFITAARGEDLY